MVYYGGVLVANSDLYHHGILGQKWGRRNGPPYPLSAGAHSSAEKKAGYKKSIKGSGGSYSGIFKKKKKNANNVETKKTNNSRKYTPEEQKSKLDKAKKDGSYDMYFLEQIQNSNILNDNKRDHTKEINKEYEEYLKDPDKYWDRARKLPEWEGDTFGNAKEDRKKAKIEKRVREQLAEIKKNNPEQYEKIKKDTIDKGKASEIKYFVDDMNNNELQYVIDRLDKKAKINSLSNRETKTNWDKVKDISDKMKIVADFTNNAANIYNNLSRLAPTEDQNKKK